MTRRSTLLLLAAMLIVAGSLAIAVSPPEAKKPLAQKQGASESRFGVVQCANLIYAQNKTSVCYSDEFLAQIQKDTNVQTNRRFTPVKLDSTELFQYPFAVMTGEGAFTLTDAQRKNLHDYLTRGGFLVASAGCSSDPWANSFAREIRAIFPDNKLKKLEMSHEVFHTVYDINVLRAKRRNDTFLSGLEVDGKIVLIYSKDGLNDTANAGPNCCCCGGNEIYNARQINVNLLAYALTH